MERGITDSKRCPAPYRLRSVLVLAMLVLTPGAVGCQDAQESVSLEPAQPVTPELRLNIVVKRLEGALKESEPESGSGLTVLRHVRFEIEPPAAADQPYSARVTVDTHVQYTSNSELDDRSLGVLALQQRTAAENQRQGNSRSGGKTGRASQQIVQRPLVISSDYRPSNSRSMHKQKVYELTFHKGRWQLRSDPESLHEQRWFQYALYQPRAPRR